MADKDFKIRKGLIVSNTIGVNTDSPSVSVHINTNDAIKFPSGNTAQRPTASNGMMRYNTESNVFEGYVNGGWNTISNFTGNGSITASGTIVNNGIAIWNGATGESLKSTNLISINANNKISIAASNTATARLRLEHGSAPGTPENGDIWTTNQDLFVRINGSTTQYLKLSGGTLTGQLTTAASAIGSTGMANSSANLGGIMVNGNGTGASFITFHRPGSYAFYFGMDVDNILKVGGWSLGAVACAIWHSGNDGAGSGLDADLLDGQQGSYYQPAASAITTSNIGSQSVNYATTAGNANALGGNGPSYYQPASSAITTSNIGSQNVNYATSSGWASGAGNADTVDGYHASAFQQAATAINTGNIGGQSVNYASSAGSASNATNASWATNSGNSDTVDGYHANAFALLSGANFSGQIYSASNILAAGNIAAYYSDKRLKKNIKPINNALNLISRLNGVYFYENDLAKRYGFNNNKEQIGVIAQEVQEIVPDAIHLAPFDVEYDSEGNIKSKSGENYLTVKYEKLVPLLIEGIKEQQNKIDKLEKMVNYLMNKMEN